MIHPHTELRFINDVIGYGVVATQFIPKGTITWALDKLDRFFEPADIKAMDQFHQDILYKYCFRDNRGRFVLCWDHARFVNHSFNSNCMSTAYDVEIAIRDIYPGEELTDDYGYLNVMETFECLPEEGTTRTHVYPDDLLRYYGEWDEKARSAFQHFKNVEQPLSHLINSKYRDKVHGIAEGKEEMDSILLCYYAEPHQSNNNKTTPQNILL